MTTPQNKVDSFEYNGFKVEICRDDFPMNPRGYDNTAILACWHRRLNLGDKQIQHMTEEELREDVSDILVLLPLYLYEHSGITMNTTGFSCQFDSGQVGWGYITKESAEKMGCVGPEWTEERLKAHIRDEVSVYDHYIRGEVYGYRILNNEDEEVESCWGYDGGMDVAAEAREVVDSWKGKEK